MRIGAGKCMWILRLWMQEARVSAIRKGVFTERAACGIHVLDTADLEEGLEIGIPELPECSSFSE